MNELKFIRAHNVTQVAQPKGVKTFWAELTPPIWSGVELRPFGVDLMHWS